LQADREKADQEKVHRAALEELKRDKQVLRDFLKQKDASINDLQTKLQHHKLQLQQLSTQFDLAKSKYES